MKNNKIPSFQGVFSNWKRSPVSTRKKLKMAFKNNWTKVRQGKACCGNYGEVGC